MTSGKVYATGGRSFQGRMGRNLDEVCKGAEVKIALPRPVVKSQDWS